MKIEKKYLNIKEVSKLLSIKEHVIRYWDSLDPKTNKMRIEGLSVRSKGGTRYFNRDNIRRLSKLKNILFENGKHNYSLSLASKLLKTSKLNEKNETNKINQDFKYNSNQSSIIVNILKNLKSLLQ